MNTITLEKPVQKIHPQKFALWMAIASMTMMFAAFTSAYLVKKGDPNGGWENFRLPDVFWMSTIAIILSSITIHLAVRALKNSNQNAHKLYLGLTVALGFA